ncbi:MAG: hypothetical protein VX278_21225, partial [Myxococcota bacterium]|nr:hypothetical protein [Myxococcota bacterium]
MNFRKLAYALIPLIVIFVVTEISLRALDWPKITAAFEHKEPFWAVDPNHKKESFPHKEEGRSFLVNTNEDGLRTAHSADLDSDWKIMTMGCSTTFGWGVGNAEAYPSRLEYYIKTQGY